jgi:hypothetical protein
VARVVELPDMKWVGVPVAPPTRAVGTLADGEGEGTDTTDGSTA